MENLKEENNSETPNVSAPEKKPEMQSSARRRTSSVRRKKAANNSKVKYIKPKKGNRVALSLVLTFLIIGISVVSSIGILFLTKELLGIDKSSASYTVTVPENATIDDVIKLMTDEQEKKKKEPIIKVDAMFRALAKFKESRSDTGTLEFVSGDHKLSPRMGYSEILTELMSYTYVERETVRITITEGKTIRDVAAMLEENKVCAANMFIYYFNKGLEYDFIKKIPDTSAVSLRFDRMEGYLFPDTYEFYKAVYDDVESLEEEDYEVIIRKFFDNFESKYTDEFSKRADELGMSMDEVITLASIVQREAADKHDMKDVASVFSNRLKNTYMFPTLGSDPTREYSKYVVEALSDPVNSRMVTAYNTYESSGLPPGPICSPGVDAITAVLWPNETNYYYFCANIETKEVYYATTNEEHEYNKVLAGITS